MAGQQVLGVARIIFDGQEIESLPDAELTLDGVERERIWAGGAWHYRETPMPAKITCKVAHTRNRTMRSLDVTDALVIFDCDNGATYHMRNAVTMTPPVLSASDGAYSLELSGSRVEEQ